MILVIDNYDSFTFNLVQAIGKLGYGNAVRVVRKDEATIGQLESWGPTHLVVSPGPCTPKEAGISCEAIRRFAGRIPILGVCLGHQCIGRVFGGRIVRAGRIMHGKTSPIHHDGRVLYDGLANPFTATRYHSLELDRLSLPRDFEITSWTDQGELMGVRHRKWPLEGVQFHPESYLTVEGEKLIANFLRGDEGCA